MTKETHEARSVIIFDLDGTLALIHQRKHLVELSTAAKQWFAKLDENKQALVMRAMVIEGFTLDQVFKYETKWMPDWKSFYRSCITDTPNYPVIDMFRLLDKKGFIMQILSGRSDDVVIETRAWLNNLGIMAPVRMRKDGDNTPDDVLKKQWVLEMYPDLSVIHSIFDDRDKVVKMWRDMGLQCFQVANGDF